MHCTQGSNLNYCYMSKEENSGRSDCRDGNGCVCVCACVSVILCQCVGCRRMDRKALSKKIFQKHFASVTLTHAVDWHALLDRNQSYQPICLALRMARSSGRGLSGKWCFSRHSLSTMCVYLGVWVSAEDGKVFNQSFDWKTPCVLKDQDYVHSYRMHVCVCRGEPLFKMVLCSLGINWAGRSRMYKSGLKQYLCSKIVLSFNFKEERSKTFSLRNLVDSYYLWIWKTNVSLSLIFHIL